MSVDLPVPEARVADEPNAPARTILGEINEYRAHSGFDELCDRFSDFEEQWRMKMPRYDPPWEHATAYNPPSTFHSVEDVHAIISAFLQKADFFASMPAATGNMPAKMLRERTRLLDELLKYMLRVKMNFGSFVDDWIHTGIVYGSAYGHLGWTRDIRNFVEELYLPPAALKKKSGIGRRELIFMALSDRLLKAPVAIDGQPGHYRVTVTGDDGDEVTGVAYVDEDGPMRKDDELAVFLRTDKIMYDGPELSLVEPWNMMVPADAAGLQTARKFWHIVYMDYEDITHAANANVFNKVSKKDLERIKIHAKKAHLGEGNEHDPVEATKDQYTSISKMNYRSRPVRVIYEYSYDDIDGDGVEESVIRAIVDMGSPILLMERRLEWLYPHGRRPFFDWHFLPVTGRYHGMGIPEILEGMQGEINAAAWARGDMLEILSKPMGIYSTMSGFDPTNQQLKPGTMFAARDANKAYTPIVMPGNAAPLFQEQMGFEQHVERAIGSTNLGLGRGQTAPNSPRTLGGTAIMVQQQQMRTAIYMYRAISGRDSRGGGLRELLQQLTQLILTFMPEEEQFMILGTDELAKVSKKQLRGRYHFSFSFDEGLTNQQMISQQAMTRYQVLSGNPLVMQNPQALWHITTDLMTATGMRNAAAVLPPPVAGVTRPPMKQGEEFAILAKGLPIEPLPNDDHQQHLMEIQELTRNTMLMAQIFDTDTLPLLESHAKQHYEAMQMQQEQMLSQQGMGPAGQRGPTPAGPPAAESGQGGDALTTPPDQVPAVPQQAGM